MRSRKAALALSGLCGPAIRSTTMMQLLISISITANYGHVQCDSCSLLQKWCSLVPRDWWTGRLFAAETEHA